MAPSVVSLGVIRKKLRPSQLEAVEAWRNRVYDGFGFFQEQRVGKSLPALACVVEEPADQLLIICPKKAISVWKKEIAESLPADWSVVVEIINYSQLIDRRRHARLRRWVAKGRTFMIVDEAHHIKRRGSRWSKRCRSLGRKATWRLALTGTAIAQGFQDAWAIFDFMDPRIFGKWAISKREGRRVTVTGGFQHRFLLMDPYWRSKVVGQQNEAEFLEIYHRHSFRRTLAEAQRESGRRATLIRRRTFTAPLQRQALMHYRELEEKLRTVVNRRRVETPLVITLSMKLQQICGGFLIDEDGNAHAVGVEKRDLLKKALDSVVIQSRSVKLQPVVVVCRFLCEIPGIQRALRSRGYTTTVIKGGVEFDARAPITTSAVILQIQSGVAIDLAFAEYLIYYSWDYSYINHEQSRFRVLSFNSSRVTYYYLVMKDTIDELILQAVRRKKNLASLVCDHYRRSGNARERN